MNYLLSRFDCIVNGKTQIYKNIKYKLNLDNSNHLIFGNNNELPICVNFKLNNNNILNFSYNENQYYVLKGTKIYKSSFVKITYLNTNYYIALSSSLIINSDKENILDIEVENIVYSHYEVKGNVLLIYFLGKRNFVVIIQNEDVKCASFYDEYNETKEEKIFMCKLKDSLNHGKVYKVKSNSLEKYLVYLDDFKLNLQPRFVCFTFLDCLLAENFKYCNNLLVSEIKQKDSENIKNFFPEFDFYFELEANTFALIKKDTLAGIFKFEIKNNEISNIIPVVHQHF